MNFKEKVLSMTAKEIVMTMVNGLRHRWVEINMLSFGHKDEKGVCFGCAATNTICEILGEVVPLGDKYDLDKHDIRNSGTDPNNPDFVSIFEDCINYLRLGDIPKYNSDAKTIGLPQLPIPAIALPVLADDYTENDLQAYVDYANTL